MGPNLNIFEDKLKKYLGQDKFVTALNSGTSAIHLSLVLLGIKPGDEVICQSFTFSASANPILYLGAIPIFVDSEPDTWNICPILLEQAIKDRIVKGNKPKAIIAVHLYGTSFKVDEIIALSNKYEIPIIEDSAEAIGSSYKGQKCGTFGSFGIFSFNGNKIITTSGGGALITNTQKLKDKAVFLATQSREDAPHYEHTEIGYNYRMSNICAAIGRGQIEVLDERISLRRKMHTFYKLLFTDFKGVTVFEVPNEDYFSNYWLTTITINPEESNGITNENLRMEFEANNIECRPLWKPMHLQPVYNSFPYYGNQVAEKLFNVGLCLPSGSNLTDEERNRITRVVHKVFHV
jgi:dTDP-4-amino-4,6-dideoxygalactose transaminase